MSTPSRPPPTVDTSFHPGDQLQVSPLDSVNSINRRNNFRQEDEYETPRSISSDSSGRLKAKAKSVIELNNLNSLPENLSHTHEGEGQRASAPPSLNNAATPRQQRRNTENKRFFDQDHQSPVLITQQSMMRLKEQIDDTDSYFNLVQFMVFLVLYMLVLYHQVGVNSGSRELKMSIRTRLFSEGGDIDDWVFSNGEKYTYDGSLFDSIEEVPVNYFNDPNQFISWFTFDILNPIFTSTSDNSTTFVTENEIIAGVLLTQTRVNPGTCTNTNFFSLVTCGATESASSDPFGVDYTFVSGHPVYDSSGAQSDYYSESEIYSNDDLGKDVPFGFFYDQQNPVATEDDLALNFGSRPKAKVQGYPITFTRTMKRNKVGELISYLDGNYVDSYTTSLTASIYAYDINLELFSYIKVEANKIQNSERWKLDVEIESIDPVVYSSEADDTLRAVLEFFYVCSLVGLILREISELRASMLQYGGFVGLIVYATNFGNMIDCGNYALQVMSNFAWLSFSLMVLDWNPEIQYSIYDDEYATHHPLKAGDGILAASQTMFDIQNFVSARKVHSTLAALSLIMSCVQLVKNLDFHPRMGLITRTIAHAAGAMLFFFTLFFSVVVVYSFMGVIQYGSTMDNFQNLTYSMQTMLIMLLGEFLDAKEVMDEVDQSITNLFFWTYYMICYFILMNAFLAIIVEAYEQTKRGFDAVSHTDAIWNMIDQIKGAVKYKEPKCGKFHISNKELSDVLSWILGINLEDEDDSNDEVPPMCSERPEAYKGLVAVDIPNSSRAIVIRKRDGDTFEDHTVTESGERIFFSQNHLTRALINSSSDKSQHHKESIEDPVVAKIVAYNILERFGMLADINEDGEVTNSEILSLKADARHGDSGLNFASAALANRAKKFAEQAEALATQAAATTGVDAIANNAARKLSDAGHGLGDLTHNIGDGIAGVTTRVAKKTVGGAVGGTVLISAATGVTGALGGAMRRGSNFMSRKVSTSVDKSNAGKVHEIAPATHVGGEGDGGVLQEVGAVKIEKKKVRSSLPGGVNFESEEDEDKDDVFEDSMESHKNVLGRENGAGVRFDDSAKGGEEKHQPSFRKHTGVGKDGLAGLKAYADEDLEDNDGDEETGFLGSGGGNLEVTTTSQRDLEFGAPP
ncbi:hypothetical protein TrVE_jg2120 [Triparma verrucosa]|uniref:Polycystin cation channel PKD1/PKD2 domain-containing protein n=1 Tax=Triparma verrucosa TaxID=1606542 RepID=A0A9W7BZK3_9STRA|nr:hypothetical protein TrVE_jg2120 [Triparma verrucosa]